MEPPSVPNRSDIKCERKKGDKYCSKSFSFDNRNKRSEANVQGTGEREGLDLRQNIGNFKSFTHVTFLVSIRRPSRDME